MVDMDKDREVLVIIDVVVIRRNIVAEIGPMMFIE